MNRERAQRVFEWPLLFASLGYVAFLAVPFGHAWLGAPSNAMTGAPGGDRLQFLWNAWWIEQSVLAGENPWFTDLLFGPIGTSLVWHSFAPLPSALIALLQSIMEPPEAYDAVVFLGFLLAGTGAWALCRDWVRDPVASFVGGLVFMFCPFLASKSLGHLNLLYAGWLPFFLLHLLRAFEAIEPRERQRASWALAATSLATSLSCIPVVVFAANVGLGVAIWWGSCANLSLRELARSFIVILTPSLIVTSPLVVLFLAYSLTGDGLPERRRDYDYNPEPLSYVLPLTKTSIHRERVADLASTDLAGIEPVAYLGWLVAPLCIAGFVVSREHRRTALAVGLFSVSVVFSLGPKLLWNREVVEVFGLPLYLPFGIWRHVPGLGAVGQPGRYLVIGYMAMGVGVACFVAWIRRRLDRRWGRVVTLPMGALVILDFGFSLPFHSLPQMPPLAGREGSVIDMRLSPLSVYYQTAHGRPLVGGSVSRPPRGVLDRYREIESFAWLMDDRRTSPTRARLLADLASHGIGDVCVDRGSVHEATLERHGFERIYADIHTSVWSVPDRGK